MQLSLEQRGWYLDKFGTERPCVVINSSMTGLVAVVSLEGEPLDIDPENVYFVPQSEKEGSDEDEADLDP